MATKEKKDIIVGLDLGTTKICAIVGEVVNGKVEIIGLGSKPSHGLKRGVVVNIERTVESIKLAVELAERMSGCEIQNVNVGIAGGHIKGITGHGMITLRSREVTDRDVERVIESANALIIPADREIIHVIPREYIVDGEPKIKEPIGMCGIKLETVVHIVTGQVTAAQNLIKCVHLAGMDVSDVILEQIASSEAVLTEDEKEIGVIMIDCGGGTTDLGVFSGGSIKYTENLTLGGDHLDKDIALGLSVSLSEARKLKEKHGIAMQELIDDDEQIKIDGVGKRERYILKSDLAMIIEPRMEEIFNLVKREIENNSDIDFLAAGAVITGGSVSMEGTVELAEKILAMPVRLGIPRQIGGLQQIISSPIYSTGVGLVQYSAKNTDNKKIRIRDENTFKQVFEIMKNWFKEFL